MYLPFGGFMGRIGKMCDIAADVCCCIRFMSAVHWSINTSESTRQGKPAFPKEPNRSENGEGCHHKKWHDLPDYSSPIDKRSKFIKLKTWLSAGSTGAGAGYGNMPSVSITNIRTYKVI